MAGSAVGKSGRTLGRGWTEGFADLRQGLWRYTLRRAAVSTVAAAAFVAGLAASSAALHAEADPGVQSNLAGDPLGAVSPIGFAWREGLRPGQLVVALSAADDPGGWRMETTSIEGRHIADSAQANAGLRASLPIALASLVLGGAAVLLLGTRRRWVVPAAALALLAASTPLGLQGNPALSTLGLAAAGILPAGWAIDRLPGGALKNAGLAFVVGAFMLAWTAARLGGSDLYDETEAVRAQLALWGTVAVLVDRTVVSRLAGEPFNVIRPRAFDVAAIALIAGAALVLMNLLSVPPLLVALLAIGGVAALPTVRHRLRPIENTLLADVRQHAAAEGAEAERARLARELHDVPLQELMGIIRRLEVTPGAESETDDLRAVAGHLRNVAMDLRPPVLDDLGLPAALQYLADEVATDQLPIITDVQDETGFAHADRPPQEVELAMFRIAAEAVTNAVQHAGASAVHIRGEVAPSRVEIEIADNGSGISEEVGARNRGKHMGIASMRRRAESIDADISVAGGVAGTAVRTTWQA
jgi:signal transduction histidine kinase